MDFILAAATAQCMQHVRKEEEMAMEGVRVMSRPQGIRSSSSSSSRRRSAPFQLLPEAAGDPKAAAGKPTMAALFKQPSLQVS
jgi:hypothetical protein